VFHSTGRNERLDLLFLEVNHVGFRPVTRIGHQLLRTPGQEEDARPEQRCADDEDEDCTDEPGGEDQCELASAKYEGSEAEAREQDRPERELVEEEARRQVNCARRE
jgi:hypothetical protein